MPAVTLREHGTALWRHAVWLCTTLAVREHREPRGFFGRRLPLRHGSGLRHTRRAWCKACKYTRVAGQWVAARAGTAATLAATEVILRRHARAHDEGREAKRGVCKEDTPCRR